MKTLAYLRWAEPPLWQVTLADALPLWLFSATFMTMGVPVSPISRAFGIMTFLLTIAVSILLLWVRWLTPELLLYSLFPLILVFNLDDISARYTTPLLVLCAFFLTVGVAGYRFSLHRDSFGLGLLILVLAAVVTWLFASHGVQNYWQMIGELGYQCVPDSPGCASLAANAIPWWILFFHP